jgi:hypothetical protein
MSTFTESTNTFVPQLTRYVNWVLIKLSTDSSISHRGYNDSESKSRLSDLYDLSEDLSVAVSTVCNELNSDQEFIKQASAIMGLMVLIDAEQECDDGSDPEDELYEAKIEIFNYVHGYIGLNEVQSLHGDSQDKFQDKFFEVVLGI